MKLTLVNLYPGDTMARYQLSSYILKAYIEKYYRGAQHLSVEVIDLSSEAGVEEICEVIGSGESDYIGYSCYVWNINKVLAVIEKLKASSAAINILGGPEITPGSILSFSPSARADYYVIAEGERILVNLLNFLVAKDSGQQTRFPQGVARWSDGKLDYTPDPQRIMNLDEIPSVYIDKVIPASLYARQQAFLETQRGCRFKCKYCVYHKELSSISYYSLPRVYGELDFLIVDKQVLALRIFDAIFPSDLERAKGIIRHLLEIKNTKRPRMPWIYWEFRYDGVDEEFVALTASLKKDSHILNNSIIPPLDRPQFYSDMLEGYTVVNSVGVESCYAPALKAVGRPMLDVEKFNHFMQMVNKYNIALKIDLILGLPQETLDSYFRGLEFLLPFFRNTDHVLNMHCLQIIPGCALQRLCDKYSISYSREAPHLVTSTASFSQEEMIYASRFTALLFRLINSPLRSRLFNSVERSNQGLPGFISSLLRKIESSSEFSGSRIARMDRVDDNYWNEDIFSELPSRSLIDIMERI
jgi:radical SAM superfamily enzyme YgiQ (UPF0313 family)